MESASLTVASRPRAFVGVSGPDAEDYLQRMLSNDVAALSPGESCEALLLTPKGRVIAPMRVLRREKDDFLLLTEPQLGERVTTELTRMRFAAKAEIALEEHTSFLLLGKHEGGIPNADYGVPAVEVLDEGPPGGARTMSDDQLEALRIEAGTPKFGSEIDERVLPAEAGLVERAVSLTKGCFPGQEPIARLHYRGHANRHLRVLDVEAADPGADIVWEGKVVGRVTSAVPGHALAFVRTEVPDDAQLEVGGAEARLH
jgi:tRNA-modifying protein YgfZ